MYCVSSCGLRVVTQKQKFFDTQCISRMKKAIELPSRWMQASSSMMRDGSYLAQTGRSLGYEAAKVTKKLDIVILEEKMREGLWKDEDYDMS